ncbi:MAG: tRNA (guanosine(46)-N7)-methyltransferase TrmB [Clostridia bacterium]|nr:tRNA (guanosine(46)-N7)-methyltransferase TrmB [Clostridia bacterium]
MRHKSNLDERLKNCADIMPVMGVPDKNLKRMVEEYKNYLNLKEIFGNDNPVYLELGCGAGGFSIEHAKRFPNVNLLAVERMGNVLITALENAKKETLPNLRFLNIPVEVLECYLKSGEITRIYLNFSTPLPEKTRAKQRLTSPRFLQIYKNLLPVGGEIHQKTDSMFFFEYSLEQLSQIGFKLKNISLDLHRSEYAAENIITEYERKFSEKGQPIYRLEAVKSSHDFFSDENKSS